MKYYRSLTYLTRLICGFVCCCDTFESFLTKLLTILSFRRRAPRGFDEDDEPGNTFSGFALKMNNKGVNNEEKIIILRNYVFHSRNE